MLAPWQSLGCSLQFCVNFLPGVFIQGFILRCYHTPRCCLSYVDVHVTRTRCLGVCRLGSGLDMNHKIIYWLAVGVIGISIWIWSCRCRVCLVLTFSGLNARWKIWRSIWLCCFSVAVLWSRLWCCTSAMGRGPRLTVGEISVFSVVYLCFQCMCREVVQIQRMLEYIPFFGITWRRI